LSSVRQENVRKGRKVRQENVFWATKYSILAFYEKVHYRKTAGMENQRKSAAIDFNGRQTGWQNLDNEGIRQQVF
jgi:hypothetical protein